MCCWSRRYAKFMYFIVLFIIYLIAIQPIMTLIFGNLTNTLNEFYANSLSYVRNPNDEQAIEKFNNSKNELQDGGKRI